MKAEPDPVPVPPVSPDGLGHPIKKPVDDKPEKQDEKVHNGVYEDKEGHFYTKDKPPP